MCGAVASATASARAGPRRTDDGAPSHLDGRWPEHRVCGGIGRYAGGGAGVYYGYCQHGNGLLPNPAPPGVSSNAERGPCRPARFTDHRPRRAEHRPRGAQGGLRRSAPPVGLVQAPVVRAPLREASPLRSDGTGEPVRGAGRGAGRRAGCRRGDQLPAAQEATRGRGIADGASVRRVGAGDHHRGARPGGGGDPGARARAHRREGHAPAGATPGELRGAEVRAPGGQAPRHRRGGDGAHAGERSGAHVGRRESARRDAGGQVHLPPSAAPPAPAHGRCGHRGEPVESDQLDGSGHRPAQAR